MISIRIEMQVNIFERLFVLYMKKVLEEEEALMKY